MPYDVSIIRPEMHFEEVKFRGQGLSADNLRRIKRGLQTFHTLETMAVNIYKFQITGKPIKLNIWLNAAMANEMTHLQDFQIKLFEYRFRPSKLRWAYWIVGFVLGFFSRLMGEKAILKAAIWVENKAVRHYEKLLQEIHWDGESRKIIEKDWADEQAHIDRWSSLLKG